MYIDGACRGQVHFNFDRYFPHQLVQKRKQALDNQQR
jgi:hypothetical protein